VAELLHELNITISLRDRVEPGLQAAPERGGSIVITRVCLSTVHEDEEIPFTTEKKNDPSLPLGQRKTIIAGKNGVLRSTFEVILEGNTEESRTLVEQIRLREPVNSVVLIGTGEPVPLLTASARGGQVVKSMEGLASWYGSQNDGLQGARTASGEIFNKNEYTAAHPTFPFGTRLRVTYLKTGRSAEVRVNDRGPWDGKRIIDLSMAAAEAIGLRSAGVGLVRIEVLQ
jgi:rare lipoprotein A